MATRKKTRPRARTKPEQTTKRVDVLCRLLEKEYPAAETALRHEGAYQLLVATILSAQCTDERVNKVTADLFRRAPDAAALDRMDTRELEQRIHSTGFFRAKTKSLKGAARVMVERFDGQVPDTMDELLQLPGVARKTANVVLGSFFGKAVGIVVDTHVKRLTGRLALSTHTDPNKIEQDLMAAVPRKHWIKFSHWLIWHGRKVCVARKPKCDRCVLCDHCPSCERPAG